MKKKIRKNIFETNSSSCHTLSLAQDNQNISVAFSRLKAGHSCICSNTFLADKEFKAYFLAAKQYNVKVFVIKMTTQYGSIHDIPKETMQRMKNRFNTCTIKPDFEYA